MYDIITGSYYKEEYFEKFFTLGELIQALESNPECQVKFLETSFTIDALSSWRGSYSIPAISYKEQDGKKAGEIAQEIKHSLGEVHYGYKGGAYDYSENDEFYVAQYGSSAEYKVVKAIIEDGSIILYTKISPY